jgi:hypothetical protein
MNINLRKKLQKYIFSILKLKIYYSIDFKKNLYDIKVNSNFGKFFFKFLQI